MESKSSNLYFVFKSHNSSFKRFTNLKKSSNVCFRTTSINLDAFSISFLIFFKESLISGRSFSKFFCHSNIISLGSPGFTACTLNPFGGGLGGSRGF